jgi:hypothetical protein
MWKKIFLTPNILVMITLIILTFVCGILWSNTDFAIFGYITLITGIYPAIEILISMYFAWIVFPYNTIKAWWAKRKKS